MIGGFSAAKSTFCYKFYRFSAASLCPGKRNLANCHGGFRFAPLHSTHPTTITFNDNPRRTRAENPTPPKTSAFPKNLNPSVKRKKEKGKKEKREKGKR